MKKCIVLIVASLFYNLSGAQRMSAADQRFLKLKEDTLKEQSMKLILAKNAGDRLVADSLFTRVLVRALKNPHSFRYPFDSVQAISHLHAPDSSFRIFTWQLVINDNVVRQHGAIQMRTADGSLKLFPLIDKSDVTIGIADTTGNHMGWIGAVYYKIIQNKRGAQNVYTLLGYDECSIRSDRKIMEILTFVNGEPMFGGNFINLKTDMLSSRSPFCSRYIMEYKKDAGPRLTYDPELKMVVAEHLVSEQGDPVKRWTMVGDGDYEGFRWENGAWTYISKIYNYVTPLGQEPVPNPLKDNGGNLNENKLNDPEDEKPVKPKPVKSKKNGGGE